IIADANINTPEAPVAADFPPTRLDEQILPRDKWVPVGKKLSLLPPLFHPFTSSSSRTPSDLTRTKDIVVSWMNNASISPKLL
ncbi:hypothetical protein Tco_1118068, partial [Tanacetum coccineum]